MVGDHKHGRERPLATTFHSYCYQLILKHHSKIGYISPPAVITTPAEQNALMKLILNDLRDMSILKQCEYIISIDHQEDSKVPSIILERWERVQKYAKSKGFNYKPGMTKDNGFRFLKRETDREFSRAAKEVLNTHGQIHQFLFERYNSDGKSRLLNAADSYDYELKNLMGFIHKAKAAGIPPSQYAGDYATIYQGLRRLEEPRFSLIDFDDMLILAQKLLVNRETREEVTERHTFLLVDEFQDLNKIQMDLVMKLQGDRGYITAVGDERQSIYGFRGAASCHNFQQFLDYFVDSNTPLRRSFNSDRALKSSVESIGQLRSLTTFTTDHHLVLSNLGNHIISQPLNNEKELDHLLARLRVGLHAPKIYPEENIPIRLWRCGNETEEAICIAREINWLLETNQCEHGDIAILFRCLQIGPYSVSANLQRQLLQMGIPVRVQGGRSLIKASEWQTFLALMRVIANPRDDLAMKRCLQNIVDRVGDATIAKIEEVDSIPKKARQAFIKTSGAEMTAFVDGSNNKDLNDEEIPISMEEKIAYLTSIEGKLPAIATENLTSFLNSLRAVRQKLGKESMEKWVIGINHRFFGSSKSVRSSSDDNPKEEGSKAEILREFISSFQNHTYTSVSGMGSSNDVRYRSLLLIGYEARKRGWKSSDSNKIG